MFFSKETSDVATSACFKLGRKLCQLFPDWPMRVSCKPQVFSKTRSVRIIHRIAEWDLGEGHIAGKSNFLFHFCLIYARLALFLLWFGRWRNCKCKRKKGKWSLRLRLWYVVCSDQQVACMCFSGETLRLGPLSWLFSRTSNPGKCTKFVRPDCLVWTPWPVGGLSHPRGSFVPPHRKEGRQSSLSCWNAKTGFSKWFSNWWIDAVCATRARRKVNGDKCAQLQCAQSCLEWSCCWWIHSANNVKFWC